MDNSDENTQVWQKPEKVLVTGASGFIGGHVVRYLFQQGLDITCLVREGSGIDFLSGLPLRFVRGDITDLKTLDKAFKGMDAIIHIAAKVDDWGSYDEFFRVNVEGTMNVLRAAAINSIKRVIMSGSVSSYGEEDFSGLKDESSPFNSHYRYFPGKCLPSGMNYYRDTKALCTRRAISFAEDNRLNLLILEPVWVYGENEFGTGFYDYLKAVKSGAFLMPGSNNNNFHVIYARDLAHAYYLACITEMKGIHRFILGNSSPENMNMIFSLFCKEAGLKPPALLPKFIVYPVGLIMEMAYHFARAAKPPLLTRARVNMFYDNIGYDTSKAMRELGFKASTPVSKGIGATVKWYQENGYL